MELPKLKTKAELIALYRDKDLTEKEVYDLTRRTAYFLLSKEVAEFMARFLKGRKVIEVGAGTGYLAEHMRRLGVAHYDAFDARVSHYQVNETNYGVEVADALTLDLFPYDVVVMAWPPFNKPFGVEVVRRMVRGQYLIHQGEGKYGCTGTPELYDLLAEQFVPVPVMTYGLNHDHVTLPGYHDDWTVLKKVK